ncbi:MAG: RadC family protein [Verrucomicrobiia bacterium]
MSDPSPTPRGLLIREMSKDEMPREKLEKYGPDTLSDAELVAILLRTGRKGRSVVDIARDLVEESGGLAQLARRTPKELQSLSGIGPAKAVTLVAALALHARIVGKQMERALLDRPESIAEYMRPIVRDLPVEVLFGVPLDAQLRTMRHYQVTRGLANQTLIHAREVYRPAIACGAAHLVLVHNHPSGDPKPSADDIRATREMAEAGRLLGIPLLDHVILGTPSPMNPAGFVSLKQMGVIGG